MSLSVISCPHYSPTTKTRQGTKHLAGHVLNGLCVIMVFLSIILKPEERIPPLGNIALSN